MLIFLQDVVDFGITLKLSDHWPSDIILSGTLELFLGRMILFMLAFMFEFVYKEKQSLILVIKMLYLDFHLIDLGGFDIFFKIAYDLILFFNLGL